MSHTDTILDNNIHIFSSIRNIFKYNRIKGKSNLWKNLKEIHRFNRYMLIILKRFLLLEIWPDYDSRLYGNDGWNVNDGRLLIFWLLLEYIVAVELDEVDCNGPVNDDYDNVNNDVIDDVS